MREEIGDIGEEQDRAMALQWKLKAVRAGAELQVIGSLKGRKLRRWLLCSKIADERKGKS